jgi:hypothetical protein
VTEWQIVVVDANPKRFPGEKALIQIGVPIRIARNWRKARYDLTVGLKRRVKENVN